MTFIKTWISTLPEYPDCWIQFHFNPPDIELVLSLDWIRLMTLRCLEANSAVSCDLDKETQCHRHHLLLMSENLMLMWPVWEVWSKLCGHYRANTWHTELCNHLRVFTLTLHCTSAICSRHTHTDHTLLAPQAGGEGRALGSGVVSWSTRSRGRNMSVSELKWYWHKLCVKWF